MLTGAVNEEPYGLAVADRVQIVVVGWRLKGRDPVEALAVDVERLTARREQRNVWAIPQ